LNIKDYIESGILEAYLLDALTPEEKMLVEANIAQFPIIYEELQAIERDIEDHMRNKMR
jgi:hypothetical protein